MTHFAADTVLTPAQALAAATGYGWSVVPHDNGGFFAESGTHQMTVVFEEDRTFRCAHVRQSFNSAPVAVSEGGVVGRFAEYGRPLSSGPAGHDEAVRQLTDEQLSGLRLQFRERAERLASLGAVEAPAAPLPGCPACHVEAERIEDGVEEAQSGVPEIAVLLRWLPCGHRFRAVVGPDAPWRSAASEETNR